MAENTLKMGFARKRSRGVKGVPLTLRLAGYLSPRMILRFHVEKKEGSDTITDPPNFRILGSFRRVDVRSSPKVVIRTSDIPNFNKKGNPPLDLPASDSDLLPFTSEFGDLGGKRRILPQYFSLFLACHVKLPETGESVWLLTFLNFLPPFRTLSLTMLYVLYHKFSIFSRVFSDKHA